MTSNFNQAQDPQILVGFDGFIDRIIHLVDRRISQSDWTRIEQINDFSQRIAYAANKSTNIEVVHKTSLIGGNAPLFTQTAAHLGLQIDLIAAISSDETREVVHPVFTPISSLPNITITPLHAPGRTDAYEFHDGKLLLGDMNGLGEINLEDLFHTISPTTLLSKIENAKAIVTLNWTMMPLVQLFWKWLIDIKMKNSQIRYDEKILFIDFADQRKRSIEDLQEAFSILKQCAQIGFNLIISLNTSETIQAINALQKGSQTQEIDKEISLEERIQSLHSLFPEAKTLVGHSHSVVCISTKTENKKIATDSISVPYIKNPYANTGAGDAFNAGFLSAIIQKKSDKEALAFGIAASGIWIRSRTPATKEKIERFLQNSLI